MSGLHTEHVNPYDSRAVLQEWDSLDQASESETTDEADERSDFDLLHRKLDHAISASFFYGGMVGMAISVALFAIVVYGMARK